MTVYYLDASAWVKRYVRERGSEWIQDLFGQRPLLAYASLGFIEVLATLSRKRRAVEIVDSRFEIAIRQLERDWRGFVEVYLHTDVLSIAADVARRYALRGADAVHLASALRVRERLQSAHDAVLIVTADQELKAAARALGITVLDPAVEDNPTQR